MRRSSAVRSEFFTGLTRDQWSPTGQCWNRTKLRAFTVSPPALGGRSPRGYRSRIDARLMGDFFVIAGIVVFTAAMLGLIWALERV
jgi:hypothetical protein